VDARARSMRTRPRNVSSPPSGTTASPRLRSLARFADAIRTDVATALAVPTLDAALRRFYRGAIKLYLSGDEGPRGCLYVCTAAVDAVHDAEIRADIAGVLRAIDHALTARIEQAQLAGEITSAQDAAALGAVAAAVLHSLAVRARAGSSRRQLEALATSAITLLLD
jgi:TetR/AcrR family transcriptional regulator, copper-responsive repressor